MSSKYKFLDQDKLYFVSFATVHWIDIFTRRVYKEIVIESLNWCMENKGLEIYGYVIMTNHIHLIIGRNGPNKMESIMRDFKKFTSVKLYNAIKDNPQESRKDWMLWIFERAGKKNGNNKNFQIWNQDNHPVELSDKKIMEQKLDYIHNNPIEAGFVSSPEEYLYSSAGDYSGKNGLLKISFLD